MNTTDPTLTATRRLAQYELICETLGIPVPLAVVLEAYEERYAHLWNKPNAVLPITFTLEAV